MKTIKLLPLLCWFITFNVQAEEPRTIPSKIKEATVFFRGAELTHTATAVLVKGENEVTVEGLSPTIDVNSLKVTTTNNVVVSAFEYSIDHLTEGKSMAPMLKNLNDSIIYYESKIDKINVELKIGANMMEHLQKGVSKNVSGSEKGLEIDELIKTMDYYKEQSEQLETAQITLGKQKKEFESYIVRLKTQLEQESLKSNKTSGILKLSLSSPQNLTSSLIITYYTTEAGWIPYYDIKIASIDEPITIFQKSKVYQTTGFDWQNVKLLLSTSTPSNGKVAPLFHAWFLREYVPVNYSIGDGHMMIQNSYAYNVYVPSSSEKKKKEVVEMETSGMDQHVTEVDNSLNIVYNIDLLYTIPGNGKQQNIDLQTKHAPANYQYYCVPKLDRETYLLAEIPEWEKLGLLSGKANITYDNTYIGETFIDASSTQEKLTLTVGTDKRVAVKREKMRDYSSTKFLGSDTQQTFTYKITVKNNQNKPMKLVLKDQYPLSTQKKIEAKLLVNETTPWSTHKEELGVVTWEEEFAAGETKEYMISYSVKYPKDMRLNL